GGMPPAASGQAYAITDTARPAIAAGPMTPIPGRSLPPGWTQGPQGRSLDEAPRVANVPANGPAGGPLMLPGSSYLRDEVIIGDIEGQGVLDRPGSDVFGADPAQGTLITPETDPFAVRR
ncbi:MAG: hypothetical protein ACRCWO_01100, partial [Bosea sp. (in: a-proteobacteria)]